MLSRFSAILLIPKELSHVYFFYHSPDVLQWMINNLFYNETIQISGDLFYVFC